jgi:segregation and condensation protein B
MSEPVEEMGAHDGSLPDHDEHGAPLGGPQKADPEPMSEEQLRSVVESLVFVADAPVSAVKLSRYARVKSLDVKRALEALAEEYAGRGIELVEVGSGWQFRSASKNAPFVRSFVAQKPVRLTRAQLETMSIIGYRQPVTRPEIDDIRGVDCGSSLKVLLERGLIKILGRKEDAGRPLLYGTTPYFLEFFGLRSLSDLPTLREFSELSDDSRAFFEKKIGDEFDPDELRAMRDAQEEATAAALAADEDSDSDPDASQAGSVEAQQREDDEREDDEDEDEDEDDEADEDDEDDEDDEHDDED